VATSEIFGENETSLQQVLSGNNMKRPVLCACVACSIVKWEINLKTWAIQTFARYDSLAIFLAHSRKKCHSLSLIPFLARSDFRFGVYPLNSFFTVKLFNFVLCMVDRFSLGYP